MKIFLPLLLAAALLTASCSNTKNMAATNASGAFTLTVFSTDSTYGYSAANPIKVGGTEKGPANERKFLNALAGPNGETIRYERLGSCCPFDSPNGFMGGGLLDKYEIKWSGQAKPVILYINMYDYDALKVPVGFTVK